MKRIPKSINVLGTKISIKLIKNWNGHKDASENLVGRYYPDTRTVYLCTKYDLTTQKLFLLHELNHVIMFVTGISQSISIELEECIAQSFASFYKDFGKL